MSWGTIRRFNRGKKQQYVGLEARQSQIPGPRRRKNETYLRILSPRDVVAIKMTLIPARRISELTT